MITVILNFHIYTGPCIVKDVAYRLQVAGIEAHDGTQNVYGQIEADNKFQAMDRLNLSAGFQLVRHAEELRRPLLTYL